MDPPPATLPDRPDRAAYKPLEDAITTAASQTSVVLLVLFVEKELLFHQDDIVPLETELHLFRVRPLDGHEAKLLVLDCNNLVESFLVQERIDTALPRLREDAFMIVVGRALGSVLLESPAPITTRYINVVAPTEIRQRKSWTNNEMLLRRQESLLRLIDTAAHRTELDQSKFGPEVKFIHPSKTWIMDDADTTQNRNPGCDKHSVTAVRCLSSLGTLPLSDRWLAFFFPSARSQYKMPSFHRFGKFLNCLAAGLELCKFGVECSGRPAPEYLLRTLGQRLFENNMGNAACLQSLAAYNGGTAIIQARRFVMWELQGREDWRKDLNVARVASYTDDEIAAKQLLVRANTPLQRGVCCVCTESRPERLVYHVCVLPLAPGTVAPPPAAAPETLAKAVPSQSLFSSFIGGIGSLFSGGESDFAVAFREQVQKAGDSRDVSPLDYWWNGWDRSNAQKAPEKMGDEVKDMLNVAPKMMRSLPFTVAFFVALRVSSLVEWLQGSNYQLANNLRLLQLKDELWSAFSATLLTRCATDGEGLASDLLNNVKLAGLFSRFIPSSRHALETYPAPLPRYVVSLFASLLKKGSWRFEQDCLADLDGNSRDTLIELVRCLRRHLMTEWESVVKCICQRSRAMPTQLASRLMSFKVFTGNWNFEPLGHLLADLYLRNSWSISSWWELCREIYPGQPLPNSLTAPLFVRYTTTLPEWKNRDLHSSPGFSAGLAAYVENLTEDSFRALSWNFIIEHNQCTSSPHLENRLGTIPTEKNLLQKMMESFLVRPEAARFRRAFLRSMFYTLTAPSSLDALLQCPQFMAECTLFLREETDVLDWITAHALPSFSSREWEQLARSENQKPELVSHLLYVSLCQRVATALLSRKPLSAPEIPNLLETAAGQLCTPMRVFWILAIGRLVELLSANDFAIPEEVAQIKHVPSHPDTATAYNRLRSLLQALRTRIDEQEFRVPDITPMLKFIRSKIKDTFHLPPWDAVTADDLKTKFNSRRDDVTVLQRTLSWLGATVREPDAQRCVTPVAADAHDKTLSLRRLKENRRLLLAKLWSLLEFRDDTAVLDEALHLLTRPAAPTDRTFTLEYGAKSKNVSTPADVEFAVFSWLINLRFRRVMVVLDNGRELTAGTFPPPTDKLKVLEKGQDFLRDLMYFREKSPLISSRARKQVPLNTLQDVRAFIARTRALVSELLNSGGQTLGWLSVQAGDANDLLGLKTELQNTAQHLKLNYNEEDLERHISAGSEILHFMQFVPHLHSADGCTALYKLEPSPALMKALEEIRNELITLAEADVHRTNLRKELRIPLPRARIFTVLKEAKPVVDFLRQVCNPTLDPVKARTAHQAFDEQCRVRQEAMSSHRFIVDDIRCIQRTWDLLSPLLWDNGPPTMDGVLAHFNTLSEACKAEEEWDIKLRQLRVAVDHLPQIRRLFNRAASFDINMLVPLVEHYMKVAVYRSSIATVATRLTLEVPEEEQRSPGTDLANLFIGNRASAERSMDLIVDVENLLSSSQVFLTDHLRPEEVDLVQRFRRINSLAHQAHDLRRYAQQCSYPNIGADVLLNERGTMQVELFEAVVNDLDKRLSAWNAQLTEAKKAQPRLALLNPLDLAQFLSELSSANRSGQRLLPYVRACFPDAHGTYGKVVLEPHYNHFDVAWYSTVTADTPYAFGTACVTANHYYLHLSRGPRGSGLVYVNRPVQTAEYMSWRKDESGHEKSFVEQVKAIQVGSVFTFGLGEERSAQWMSGSFSDIGRLVWDGNEECVTECFVGADDFVSAIPPANSDGCELIEVRLGPSSSVRGVSHTSTGQILDETLFCSDGLQPPKDVLLKADGEKRELHFQSHGVAHRLCDRLLEALKPGMEPLASALELLQSASRFVKLNTEPLPHESLQKLIEVNRSADLTSQHFSVLRANLNVPLSSSCRLVCSPDTSKAEMRSFLSLVQELPNLSFGVVGVNRLSLAARKRLLKFCTKRFLVKATEGSLLILLFTEPQGREGFAFIPSEPAVQIALPGIAGIPFRASLPRERFLYWLTEPGTGKTYVINNKLRALKDKCTTLTLDVCEDFSVAKLIDKLETACTAAGFAGLAVYWNVSAYAPLTLLSDLLLDILYFQAIHDRFVLPICALRYLLLELHRAPVDQLRMAGRFPDTDQAVLESLPALNFATRATLSQEELQCYDGAEAQLVAALYARMDGTWTDAKNAFSAAPAIKPADCSAVISSLGTIQEIREEASSEQLIEFALGSRARMEAAAPVLRARGFDPNKLPPIRPLTPYLSRNMPRRIRMMFLALLATRLRWLESYIGLAWIHCGNMEPDVGQLPSPSELMHAWIREVGQLCSEELPTSASENPFPYISLQLNDHFAIAKPLAFLSSRQMWRLSPLLAHSALWLDNLDIRNWNAEQAYLWLTYVVPALAPRMLPEQRPNWTGAAIWEILEQKGGSEARYFEVPPDRTRELKLLGSALDGLRSHHAQLRIELAAAFRMKKTARMAPLLQLCNYHLTSDLFLKILALNERRKARGNVVMTGLTGVGKTEILRILAYILNADSSEMPNPIYKLRRAIYKTEKERHSRAVKLNGKPVPDAARSLVERFPYLASAECAAVLDAEDMSGDALLQVINKMALTPPPVAPASAVAAPDAPLPVQNSIGIFATAVLACARALLAKPLLSITEKQPRLLAMRAAPLNTPPPVIDSIELLMEIASEICSLSRIQVFTSLLMHQHYSVVQLRAEIARVEQLAKAHPSVQFVVFIDEVNTAPALGVLNSVFVDSSLLGLPDNIFWVAAMNPQKNKDYDVRPAPLSMEQLQVQHGALRRPQEAEFVHSMLAATMPRDRFSNEQREVFARCICEGQEHLRMQLAQESKISPSLRDVSRAVHLRNFFETRGKWLLDPDISSVSADMQAMIFALACTYLFRLHATVRGEFETSIARILFPNNPNGYVIKNLISRSTLKLLDMSIKPKGVASTVALRENLFCIVVSVSALVPLLIKGPAGCAKTLSFTIAMENIKEGRYPGVRICDPIRYQVSSLATDTEIEGIYIRALELLRDSPSDPHDSFARRSVVLLDEANLADERASPLKVLHYHLDHPRVATVMLANEFLDAAKMNRMMLLQQSNPQHEDLRLLATGTLLDRYVVMKAPEGEHRLIWAICDAYMKLESQAALSNEFAIPANRLFNTRDFTFVLRHLRRASQTQAGVVILPAGLQKALQRNIGGLPPRDLKRVVGMFFAAMREQLGASHREWDDENIRLLPVSELLKESLQDFLKPGEDANTSCFRYCMLLDPTDSEASVALLHSLGVLRDVEVVSVSTSAGDPTEQQKASALLKIKRAMQKGETILLLNSASIVTCLYDLFNRYFDRVPGPAAPDGSPTSNYYVRIAIGAVSRLCEVHPRFKIILHMSRSQLRQTPGPLLSRFEKYILSVEQILHESPPPWVSADLNQPVYRFIYDGVNDFVARNHEANGQLLYGVVPRETAASLMKSLPLTQKPEIPPAFSVPPPTVGPDNGSEFTPQRLLPADRDVSRLIRATIRALNLRLLQLARPEEIFFCRHLPDSYIEHYLMHQEHLSVVRFLSHLTARTHVVLFEQSQADVVPPRRWIIFCRSSAILLSLENLRTALSEHFVNVSFACFDLSQLEAELAKDVAVPPETVPLFLSVAELGRYTTAELNAKRDALRAYQEAHPSAIVVLLLHFPAHRQLGSLYDAIFLNQWEYLYVDSLGIDLNKTESRADARSWVATAFGLKRCHSPADVQNDLESLFDELLHDCIADILFMPLFEPQLRAFNLSPATKAMYTSRASRDVRVKLIKETLLRKSSLTRALLASFTRLWQTELLHRVVEKACTAIKRGEHTDSLLSHVASSLRFLLRAMVMKLLYHVLRYFSINRILTIMPQSQEEELLCAIVNLIQPPYEQQDSDPVLGRDDFSLPPPRSLLYQLVALRIEELVIAVKEKEPTLSARNFHAVFFRRAHHAHESLGVVLQQMAELPEALNNFKLDFMSYTLKVPAGTEEFCKAVYEYLMQREGDRLQVEAWVAHTDVLCYFSFRQLAADPSFAALAGQYAAPLTRLRPTWLRERLPALLSSVSTEDSTYSLEFAQKVITLVLTVMLRQLAGTPRDADKSEAEGDMKRWCEAMMELRAFAQWWPFSAQHQNAVFAPGVQYDVMLCFLLVVLHRRLLPAAALQLVCEQYDAIKALYSRIPIGIPDLVGLAHQLCGADHAAKRSVTVELLANVVPFVLVPAARPFNRAEDLRSFAVLCCDAPGPRAAPYAALRAVMEGDRQVVLLAPATVVWLWSMIWRNAPRGMPENIFALASEVVASHCEYASSEQYEPRMRLLPLDACDGMEAPQQPCSMLETALMLCHYHHLPAPAERAALLHELLRAPSLRTVASRLQRAALAAASLSAAAQDLSSATCNMRTDEWVSRLASLVTRLLPARTLCAPLIALETLVAYLQPDVAFRFLKEVLPRLDVLSPAEKAAWSVEGATDLSQRLFAVFRFMLPGSEHALAAAYSATKAALQGDAANLLAFLRNNCQTDADRLRTRLLVALAAFYEFSDKGQPCGSLMELLLNNALVGVLVVAPAAAPQGQEWRALLPTMELNAYRLLAMGPQAATTHLFAADATLQQRKDDVLANAFCAAGMKRTILVNTLAVALGCPEHNHIYACTFYVAASAAASPAGFLPLNSKGAPGSAEHRAYFDCGFKMPFPTEKLVDQPNVLGNNKLHRMALGSLCWVGFSLASLIGGALPIQHQVTRALGDQQRMYHLLNFLRRKNDVVEIRDTLVQHWKAMIKRMESDNAGLLANHYMNESLLQFWSVANRLPSPQGLMPIPDGADQLGAYEGVWQREVFAVVDRELEATRKAYADVAARTGAAMCRVTTLQAARVGKVLPPAVSPDILSKQLLAAPNQHAILSEVLAVAPITQALAQVPAMLQFYRELSHLVAHNRLWSKERLRTTHVKDAIVQLAKEMEEDPQRAADLVLHFEQFKIACKKMQDAFFVLPNQNGANEVLLGCEQVTVQVTPESTVESLLNVQDDALLKPGEKDSASQILLLVGYVVKKQSDLFSRESFINALNAKVGEYPLLDICSSVQSLRSLTECLENDPRLLRVDVADLTSLALCHTNDPSREVMPLSLPASAVNLDAVEAFVVSHLLYGRCSFQDPNADQRVKVIVVPADGIDKAKDGFEPLFTAVAFLKQLLERLQAGGRYDAPLGELEKVLELHLKTRNSPELLAADVKWLSDLLTALMRTHESGTPLEGTTWEKLPAVALSATRAHLLLFRNQSPCPLNSRFLFKHLRRIGAVLVSHAESASCFGQLEPLPADVLAFLDGVEWRRCEHILRCALQAGCDIRRATGVQPAADLAPLLGGPEVSRDIFYAEARKLLELPQRLPAAEFYPRVLSAIADVLKRGRLYPNELRRPFSFEDELLHSIAPLERRGDQDLLRALKLTSDRLRALQERASGSAATVLLPLLQAHEEDQVRAVLEELVPPTACITHMGSLQRRYFEISIKIIDRERQATACVEYTELVPRELDSEQTLSSKEVRTPLPGPPPRAEVIVEPTEVKSQTLPVVLAAQHPLDVVPARQNTTKFDYEPIARNAFIPLTALVVWLFAGSLLAVLATVVLVSLKNRRRLMQFLSPLKNASPVAVVQPEPEVPPNVATLQASSIDKPPSKPFVASALFSLLQNRITTPEQSTAGRAALELRAGSLGLKIEAEISEGGDCQFAAAAYQLHELLGVVVTAKALREQVVSWLRVNASTKLTPGMPQLSSFVNELNWDEYCQRMKRESEWGDCITLLAIAQVYQIEIALICAIPAQDLVVTPTEVPEVRGKLLLGYYPDAHFVAVV